jgi:hypothetical protein
MADLRRSGLTTETLQAAGVYSVSHDEIGKKLGGLANGVVSALAFPYPGFPGFERYKVFREKDKTGPKYLQKPGTPNHFYFPPGVDLKGDSPLLLVEGEKKAMALRQAGFQVVGIGGVWNWLTKGAGEESKPIQDFDIVKWDRAITIVFDSDGHGNLMVRLAAFRLARELASRGAEVSILFLPAGPKGEKVGADDYLVAHGPDAYRELLETAWAFNHAWTDPETEAHWQIRDLTRETPKAVMRIRLSALVPELARMRHLEVEGLFDFLKEHLKVPREMLTALRRDLKAAREDAKKAPKPKNKEGGLLPEEEIKALKPLAAPLLQCPNILEKVAEALRCRGLAGQMREAKVIYLALTSRVLKLKVLVNVAVKGPSSGGKSFVVEVVLELFPPSAFYALTAMSEKALAYSQEPLCHRHMVIYEAAGLGSEFAQYLMRSLLSEGRVRYETVEKTKGGLVPRLIEREGPTGLIVTTTRAGLHPENETRMLTLEVDDTPAQTCEVMKAHAEGELPKGAELRAVDVTPFKALQRLLELEKPQVVVPFAMALAEGCDPTAVRLRRDFLAVLNLVKAHAILHAHHRERDAQGRVIAIVEDYAAVYDLVADLVSYGTGQKVSETIRKTVEAVRKLEAGNSNGVSYTAIGKELRIDESAARRRVKTAISKGYLENRETKPRCAAKIVTAEPMPDGKEVLPHPKLLSDSPPESTADLPTDDYSCVKTGAYGRQPERTTDCRPPTTAPGASGVEGLDYGQAVGNGSDNGDASHNYSKSQVKDPWLAGRQDQWGVNSYLINARPISRRLSFAWTPPRQRHAASKVKETLAEQNSLMGGEL